MAEPEIQRNTRTQLRLSLGDAVVEMLIGEGKIEARAMRTEMPGIITFGHVSQLRNLARCLDAAANAADNPKQEANE